MTSPLLLFLKQPHSVECGNEKHWNALLESKKEFKRTIKKAQSEGWRNFCSSITRETQVTDIWKMAKIFKGKVSTSRNEDCSNWINEFMDKHSQPTPCNNLNELELHNFECEYILRKITSDDVQNKINGLKKSAAGLDKISNNVLKALPQQVVETMTGCFNEICETGIIPESWKICKVIPLQKPGKPSELASSKRPISIFGKTRRLFESIILDKLDGWAENEKCLSSTQYGFRKGRSTRDCVAILVADIRIAFSEKKFVGAIFLDISAAYDNVNIETFVKKASFQEAS